MVEVEKQTEVVEVEKQTEMVKDRDGSSRGGEEGSDRARNSEQYNRSRKEGGGGDEVVVEKKRRARSVCGVEGNLHVTRSITVPVKPKYPVTGGRPA